MRTELGSRDDRAMAEHAPRQVVILLFEGVQSLDVTGPLEVFAGAQRLIEPSGRGERAAIGCARSSTDGAPLRSPAG